MTPYEIADLRNSIGMRYTAINSIWMTATFALFAAAFAAGSALTGASIAALLLFYALVCAWTGTGQLVVKKQITAILAQAEIERSKAPGDMPLLQADNLRAPLVLDLGFGLTAISFAGFVFFVLDRAGLLF